MQNDEPVGSAPFASERRGEKREKPVKNLPFQTEERANFSEDGGVRRPETKATVVGLFKGWTRALVQPRVSALTSKFTP